jgi:hypothetical protein
MKALMIGLLTGLAISATAQKSPAKFGEIPLEDLKMTTYDKDSSAAAVVLVDYGEAYIQVTTNSAVLKFERQVRIKILKKEGLEWADAFVPLYQSGSNEERVTGLKASTYNLENGKIIESKMSKEAVFKEKFNRNINHQKFTLPNAKVGCVIEYTYTIVSDFFTNFPNWQFQRTIPTRLSEYWAVIPEFFFYEKYMQGYLNVSNYEVKNTASSVAHHWILTDVPAFKVEPYMTCEEDYVSKINFALSHISFPGQMTQEVMGSWQKLNELLLNSESFMGTVKTYGFLKKKVEEITTGIADPIQKIAAIHAHVKQTIEWDGTKDFYAANLKKIVESKKGSSGDINLLLGSMLEKAGFSVDMVLLSTRDHGFVRRQYPMSDQFNYTICSVMLNDKTILLDATEKYLPYTILPERCLNGEGLVISKANHGWVNLENKIKSRTAINADLTLSETGDLKGKLNFSRDGYDANQMRKSYDGKGKETYMKDFIGSKTWEIEKSDFQNIKEIDQNVKETHDLTIREHATVAGDVIYVNPFVTSQMSANPFSLDKREYPVDFGSPLEKIYMCKLTIPEGFVVDEAPQSKVLLLPGNTAKYLYNVVQNGNTIVITSNFQINKSIFTQLEYPNLREFYTQVIAKQTEQIVLKRK